MIRIEIKNDFSDVLKGLERLEKKVGGQVLIAGVAAMAKVIYEEAKLNAGKHRKTGTLQDAIYRVYSPEKSKQNSKTYRISWNKKKAPHGHLLEFGTVRAPAYPFLRPAFDQVGTAIEAGKARMAQKLEEVKGK